MKEIVRDGLKFSIKNDDYQIPAELGEELMRRNQELIDAKNRQAPEVSSETQRTGKEVS